MNASKKEKKALQCLFLSSTPRQKTTKSFCKERALKLAESNKGSYYNQEKRWKDNKASEKPIETTTESSFMSFLASGASFLGCKAAKWMKKSQSEVPRHIKIIGWRTFSEVYCSGREASRKSPVSSMLSILQGKCRTFRKYISSKSELGLTCLVRCENKNCLSQINNDTFWTTERIEQSRAFEITYLFLCCWVLFATFSCCITIVVPFLVCNNIDSFGVIICHNLVTRNMPPTRLRVRVFFHR